VPVSISTAIGGTDLVENGTYTILPGPDGQLSTSADNVLQLTANTGNQTSSVWTKNAQTIVQTGKGTAGADGFSSSFNLVIPAHSATPADGMTFTIQRVSNTALGGGGGSVGYVGIPNSVAVHFRYYDNGNSISKVGVYTNGVQDASNEVDTTAGGLTLTNGDSYKVDISYDNAAQALTVTITDLTNNAVTPFTATFSGFDIPTLVGGPIGYVGLTGATGGATAEQDISNFSFDGTALPFVAPITVVAPKVTNVYVRGAGTLWKQPFLDFLASSGAGNASYGYNIAGGATQLKDLPWTNINQISIKFDSDVALTQGALVIKGVNTPTYSYAATNGFVYDAVTHVATWTLTSSVTADKLLMELASAGVSAAGDPTVKLDGEYVTSTTIGASGDGTAGGDFNFRVNVLPGDVNQTSPVNATDVTLVKNRQERLPPSGRTMAFSSTRMDRVTSMLLT